MSYIRIGHPLQYFEGNSTEYVYPEDGGRTQDYGSDYDDNATLAELLVNFIHRATDDKAYAWKMAGILAEKLNVKRRKHLLSTEEYFKLSKIETDKAMKEYKKEVQKNEVSI